MAADDHLNEPDELHGLDDLDVLDAELDALARLLRDAHHRVRALRVPDEERIRQARRLLAICDAAKKDVRGALSRLEMFMEELEGPGDTPGSRNIPLGD